MRPGWSGGVRRDPELRATGGRVVFYTEVILANGFALNNDLLCILSSSRSEKEGDDDGNGQFKFREKFFSRLVGILDPQWHFGSTLANRLAL